MKTIGLLGGMSWESSALYYQTINTEVKKRLWGLNSAKILMHSVNFAEIEALQHAWNWDALTEIMVENAQSLEKWWADFILICTNTMHKMAEAVQASISIPLIHIADATAKEIANTWIHKIALLGTAFTMEQHFYKWRLMENYGLDVVVPDETGRADIHRIIYEELCQWIVRDESREIYKEIIQDLKNQWAEWVILGCTEITMLISEEDSALPIFDTTEIHALEAVSQSLS